MSDDETWDLEHGNGDLMGLVLIGIDGDTSNSAWIGQVTEPVSKEYPRGVGTVISGGFELIGKVPCVIPLDALAAALLDGSYT